MEEWHYNRLKTGTTSHRDATTEHLLQQGWVEEVEEEVPRPSMFSKPEHRTLYKVTDAGRQAMAKAEAAWEALRKDPETRFYSISTNMGQIVVRAVAPEVAERALSEKFGQDIEIRTTHPDRSPVVEIPDCYDPYGALNSFLDTLNPDARPYFRTFTGRPLGDAEIEFRVCAGLPPM